MSLADGDQRASRNGLDPNMAVMTSLADGDQRSSHNASGFRALAKVMLSYQRKRGLLSVHAMINCYAPPSENATDAHVKAVAHEIGVDPDLPYLADTADRMI